MAANVFPDELGTNCPAMNSGWSFTTGRLTVGWERVAVDMLPPGVSGRSLRGRVDTLRTSPSGESGFRPVVRDPGVSSSGMRSAFGLPVGLAPEGRVVVARGFACLRLAPPLATITRPSGAEAELRVTEEKSTRQT